MNQDKFRKIGIGNDMKNAMFYVIGSRFKNYTISDIILKEDNFIVYVKNQNNEVQEWKTFHKSIVTVKERILI